MLCSVCIGVHPAGCQRPVRVWLTAGPGPSSAEKEELEIGRKVREIDRYMYIYIYREREIEREKERGLSSSSFLVWGGGHFQSIKVDRMFISGLVENGSTR